MVAMERPPAELGLHPPPQQPGVVEAAAQLKRSAVVLASAQPAAALVSPGRPSVPARAPPEVSRSQSPQATAPPTGSSGRVGTKPPPRSPRTPQPPQG